MTTEPTHRPMLADTLIGKQVRITVPHMMSSGIVHSYRASDDDYRVDNETGTAWFDRDEFEVTAPAIDIPAPATVPQPLQRLEELEAENARLQRRVIELETINECQTEEITERRKNIGRLNTVVMNVMMELDIFTGWFTTTYEENQVAIIEAIQALKKVESAA